MQKNKKTCRRARTKARILYGNPRFLLLVLKFIIKMKNRPSCANRNERRCTGHGTGYRIAIDSVPRPSGFCQPLGHFYA